MTFRSCKAGRKHYFTAMYEKQVVKCRPGLQNAYLNQIIVPLGHRRSNAESRDPQRKLMNIKRKNNENIFAFL